MGFGKVRNTIHLFVTQDQKQNPPNNLMMTCDITFPKEQKKIKLLKIILHLETENLLIIMAHIISLHFKITFYPECLIMWNHLNQAKIQGLTRRKYHKIQDFRSVFSFTVKAIWKKMYKSTVPTCSLIHLYISITTILRTNTSSNIIGNNCDHLYFQMHYD